MTTSKWDILDDILTQFILPPDSLQERYEDLPPLYNPPKVIDNLRKLPIQEVVSSQNTDESPSSSTDSLYASAKISTDDLSFANVIRNILYDIGYHKLAVFWIALLTSLFVIDYSPFIHSCVTFALGAIGAWIVSSVLIGSRDESETSSVATTRFESFATMQDREFAPGSVITNAYLRSQGWMLTLSSDNHDYDSHNFHLSNTRVVFVRITGPVMVISQPFPKHRIPKRRLWNDPMINTDHIFVRHTQYNLHGAKVELLPSTLSRKGVWNCKYPIGIQVACREKVVGKLQDNIDEASVHTSSGGAPLRGEVVKEECSKCIYLFARTHREKDDWFRRLVAATKARRLGSASRISSDDFDHFLSFMMKSCPSLWVSPLMECVLEKKPESKDPWETISITNLYSVLEQIRKSPKSTRSTQEKINYDVYPPLGRSAIPSFLNAVLARLFYDVLMSNRWKNELKFLFDRKLHGLHKPAFVDYVRVTEFDMGESIPIITKASLPTLDKQGLWVDLDLNYNGKVVITLEAGVYSHASKALTPEENQKVQGYFEDSESDDYTDSEDEIEPDVVVDKIHAETKASRPNMLAVNPNKSKFQKLIDKAKHSVLNNRHVQDMVRNMSSNRNPLLTVEIKQVDGIMAINIPPSPNNRIWLGFRTNPTVSISVKPKLGHTSINITPITEWMTKKILLTFQRLMVCPNMMDFEIPILEFELPK